MKFNLEIETGNDAMQTVEELSTELRRVSVLVDDGYTSGPCTDLNGNTVGAWTLLNVD